jgi:hypothetical protein
VGEKKNLAEIVDETVKYCLYKLKEVKDGNPPEDAIIVDGIIRKFAFHPVRITEKQNKIRWLIDQMPIEFQVQGERGGGQSFLKLCVDKNGAQWGEHIDMEALICLGLATGMARYCFPRRLWDALPGGMPYVQFDIVDQPPFEHQGHAWIW